MKVITTDQMQQLEQEAIRSGTSLEMLMENAGEAVASEAKRFLDDIRRQHILILIGPGNNGGDGLVAARHLHDAGAKIFLYFFGERPTREPIMKPLRDRRIKRIDAKKDENLDELKGLLASVDTVIDALFGTGTTRPFSGLVLMILDRVRRAKIRRPDIKIIALDLPSGLNADTGEVDPGCLYVDNTITLAFPKPGLFKFPGAERVGEISVVDIGLPGFVEEETTPEYLADEWVQSVLPERSPQANKGNFGKVLVLAGSANYIGAPYLACSGAMRVGAGLVTLAATGRLQAILANKLTEVTYMPLPESRPWLIAREAIPVLFRNFEQYNVLLMGCGMGQNESVVRIIRSILLSHPKAKTAKPKLPSLVLDADALNALALVPKWWDLMPEDAILTPHPGEMARLTGMTVDEVQLDRLELAKKMAAEWHKTIVLKGAYTVIASPDGRTQISHVANAGLASAGTGDVLAGVIAGLLAQGLSFFDAAAAGVYIHGMAGGLVKDRLGDAGMVASDLLPELPLVIKRLKEGLPGDEIEVEEVVSEEVIIEEAD
ncbi:MAG: NAD(P)H-hydrate dehydratase [Dehalococcoidia bacterium]